mmetsp:Transcript_7447/g.17030  ORF Transcript_7447/g.17030 Transcript_7447/m.17030 type:complete len:153 (+) Transcript_7447:1099-1557(+)
MACIYGGWRYSSIYSIFPNITTPHVEQEQERNRNREPQKGGQQRNAGASNGADVEGGRKYRGPDKIKGGRIVDADGKVIPRQRGGKKGRQQKASQNSDQSDQPGDRGQKVGGQNAGNKQMSAQQQRRKNANKAKIANHHRKERAQKKAASGM